MKYFRNIFLPIIFAGILLCFNIYGSNEINRYLIHALYLFPILLIIIGIIKSRSISEYFKTMNKEAHKTGVRRRAFVKSAFLGKEPEHYINKSIQKNKNKRKKKS